MHRFYSKDQNDNKLVLLLSTVDGHCQHSCSWSIQLRARPSRVPLESMVLGNCVTHWQAGKYGAFPKEALFSWLGNPAE